MKLFTKEIDKKLFAQYSMGSNLENQMVVAKIFNPYGRGVWYLLNSDPNDPDYLWAIVNLFEVEMGSVSRSELESILVPPFRLPLERDLYFTPVNAKVLYDGLLQGKHYAKGGGVDATKDLSQLKKYQVYIYYGGEQENKVLTTYSLETAKNLAKQGEHAEIIDFTTGEMVEFNYAKGGGIGSYYDKAKNMAKSKAKEIKRDIALDVVNDTRKKVDGKRDVNTLRAASELIDNRYAKGGGVEIIKNQYSGKSAKEVYELWDYGQKYEFFKDHFHNAGIYSHSDYKRLPSKKYDELDEISKNALITHIKDGQYAKGGGVGSPLSQAKKKVASMSDSEVAEEVETILAYEMMDYDETGEDLMNDMKAARMFLVEHYEEQFTDIDITPFSNGGGVGYQHDVNIVTNREGENYLFPSDKEDNSMGVLLKRGGRASEVLKDTDYVSNRKIDAVIIDGKRYDGKSIVDGVYLRKTASGSADMPQQSAAPVVEPSKPKPAKPTRKPKPMSDGGELLIPQLAETDAQMFERRFGVSVNKMADKLKGYDAKSVLRGDAQRTYESISGKEVSESERAAFFKFLLAGFSFYDIKLGKSKAIMLPNFDEQDLDNGLRINVKPQYAKPLANEGFLSMKNILGTDVLRPIMMCVYFDDGNLIGTDAHKIVIIKQTQSETELKSVFTKLIEREVNKYAGGRDADKIIEEKVNAIFDGGLDKKPINFTTGMFEDGTKFPNYQAVIPKNTEYTESVSIQSLIDACNGVYEVANNCYQKFGILKINFQLGQNEGQDIGFNAEFLLDTLQVLQVNGAKSVKLSPSTPTRGCGIYADNGNYGLIMPIYSDLNVDVPCNYSIPMQTTESNFIPSESVIAKFKYKAGGKITEAQREKIETVMDEYGQGKLNIGLSDKIVTNRKQAVAIALSEAGVSNKSKRGWKHKK